MSLTAGEKRLVRKLIAFNKNKGFWIHIRKGKEPTKREANKFFLSSILDYQMKADFVWDNTQAFIESFLGDPEDLWNVIAAYSPEGWMQVAGENSLHRFPAAKQRVYRIARQLVDEYAGDARNIWKGATAQEVSQHLKKLQAGEQISRMILGALYDCNLITGALDVKADIHVSRVLGRLLSGQPFTPGQAVQESRRLHP